MAKLKIRKLSKDLNILQRNYNNLVAMMALTVHNNGGHMNFSKEDIMSLPEAAFLVNAHDEGFELQLKYEKTTEPDGKEQNIEQSA